MATNKKDILDTSNLFFDLGNDLDVKFTSETGKTLSIIDFIDHEIDLGIDLTRNQRLILKVAYNVPLDEEDISILEYWRTVGKTTWTEERNISPQIVVIQAGRRSGKCRGTNSLHFSQKYGMMYGYEIINEAMGINHESYLLTDKEIKTLTLEEKWIDFNDTVAIEGKNKTAQASALYVKGFTKTRKVTTACGYNLEATPEHRIKVIDKKGNIIWSYFNDLKQGDYVCIHRNTNLFSNTYLMLDNYLPNESDYSSQAKKINCNNIKLSADYGHLLGLLTANGSWTQRRGLNISHHSSDIDLYVSSMKSCLEPLGFGSNIRTKQSSENGMLTICGSVLLRKLFDNLGFTIESRVNMKKTPWSIRRSPKDVQAAYLSGLFDGDGSVEKQGKAVTLSSASKQLIEETQLMLLNFGIVSNTKTKIVKDRPYYILTLRGRKSVEIFVKEIGFRLARKQDLVLKNLNSTVKDGGDTERIPYQLEWLTRLRDTLPNNIGRQPGSSKIFILPDGSKPEKLRNLRLEYREIVGNSIKPNSGESFSYYRLPKLLEFAKEHCNDLEAINHFEYLNECNYFYDPVVSIEETESYCMDLSVPGVEEYVAQGMTNHNSSLAAIMAAYEFYCLSKLESPQKHYGVATSTPIGILVLATTAEQARKMIFRQIIQIFNNSDYFQQLVRKKLIYIGKEEISYDTKGIYVQAGNSKSAAQVGGTLKCFILDEASRFQDSDGESNALKLWKNIGISCAPFGYNAKRIAISSAWFEGDAIQKLCQSAENEPNAESFSLVSWDLNTTINKENPVVAYDYSDDPVQAALEYENIRPAVVDAFLDPALINKAVSGKSCIVAKKKVLPDTSLVTITINSLESRVYSDTVLHIDPAIKTDNYAMAFGHSEFDRVSGLQIVHIDGLLAWQPEYNEEVSISNVGEAIRLINKKRPLALVTADHYNSAETIQRLKQDGIKSEIVYFSNRNQLMMYTCLKTLLAEDRIIFPKDSGWIDLLVRELSQVQLIDNVKIDHPKGKGYSKDLADAVSAVAYHLSERVLIDGCNYVNSNNQILLPQNYIDPSQVSYKHKALSKISQRKSWALGEWNASRFKSNH